LFYSLIESAKLAGVEPRAYLREATLRTVRNPGTATLPRDLKSSESREKTTGRPLVREYTRLDKDLRRFDHTVAEAFEALLPQ
jgi:hypothetical protein